MQLSTSQMSQNIESERYRQIIEKSVFIQPPAAGPLILIVVSDLFVQVLGHKPGTKVLIDRLDAVPKVGLGRVEADEKRRNVTYNECIN